jgi:FKBP-type peptidyl-prolyl cis-trans isomerase
MKTFRLGAIVALLAACGKQSGSSNVKLASAQDSVSYIIGFQIGGTLKQQGAPVRAGALANGVQDAISGATPKFTQDQMRAIITAYQQKQRDSSVSANSAESDKFLADNAKKDGVKSSPTGLQWKVLREGKGPHPKPTDTVTVHYKGTLLNGTPFDSSYGGSPVSFPLNRVIAGWTEGVQLMSPGAKYQFWLPAKLAYGENGSPPAIGPNATLIFEVELVSIKKS